VEEPLLGEVGKVLFPRQMVVAPSEEVTVHFVEVKFVEVMAVDPFAGVLFVEATVVVPFAEEASVVL
jgi:hypothetical protein